MRVTCPSCLVQYELPAEVAAATPAAGRWLRCAECGQVWHHHNPEAVAESLPDTVAEAPRESVVTEPALETPPVTEPEAKAESPATARPLVAPADGLRPTPRGTIPAQTAPMPALAARPAASPLVWIGWAGSVVIVLAVLALLWIERASVIRAVPAAAPIYAALGLAPSSAPQPAKPPHH